MTGSFPLTIETPDAIATQVLNVLFYGLPIEELQTFRERVNAVTVDDIERVARAYLQPDRLSIVLVGNAGGVRAATSGRRVHHLRDGRDAEPRSDHRRLQACRPGRIGSAPAQPRLRVDCISGAAAQRARRRSRAQEGAGARALLDRVIAAKGGLETLRGVKSITRDHQDLDDRGRPFRRTRRPTWSIRIACASRPSCRTWPRCRCSTASRGWVRDPRGVHDVPARALRDLRSSAAARHHRGAAGRGATDALRARLLPDVKDEDGTRHHALELSGTDLDPMVLYVDPDTGLIAKQTYVAGGAGQPLIEEVFSDYRPVDGVQIAFRGDVRRGGQQVLERRVTDIKINAPIDPALFKRPAS